MLEESSEVLLFFLDERANKPISWGLLTSISIAESGADELTIFKGVASASAASTERHNAPINIQVFIRILYLSFTS